MKTRETTKMERRNRLVYLDFNDVKSINDEIIYHCKRWVFSKKQLKNNQIAHIEKVKEES